VNFPSAKQQCVRGRACRRVVAAALAVGAAILFGTGACGSGDGGSSPTVAGKESRQQAAAFTRGEDWWWCYPDELFFEVPGAPPAPSHS
jgi:hypothetical protein